MKNYNTIHQLLTLQKVLIKIYVAEVYLLPWKDVHKIQLRGDIKFKQYLQMILL